MEIMLPAAQRQEIGDKVHKVDTAINVLISAGLSSPSLRFLDSALEFNAITSRGDIGIDHGLNLGVVFLGPLLMAPSILNLLLRGNYWAAIRVCLCVCVCDSAKKPCAFL